MTRSRSLLHSTTGLLTIMAVALFLLLSEAFGNGLLAGPRWNSAHWVDSL